MKSQTVTLKFYSIENLGKFINSCEEGHYANVLDLTAKGSFSKRLTDQAINHHGAMVVSTKAKKVK